MNCPYHCPARPLHTANPQDVLVSHLLGIIISSLGFIPVFMAHGRPQPMSSPSHFPPSAFIYGIDRAEPGLEVLQQTYPSTPFLTPPPYQLLTPLTHAQAHTHTQTETHIVNSLEVIVLYKRYR